MTAKGPSNAPLPPIESLQEWFIKKAALISIIVAAAWFVWEHRTDPFAIVVTGIVSVYLVHELVVRLRIKNRGRLEGVVAICILLVCIGWYRGVKPVIPPEPAKGWFPPELPDSIQTIHCYFGRSEMPIPVAFLETNSQPYNPFEKHLPTTPFTLKLKENRIYVTVTNVYGAHGQSFEVAMDSRLDHLTGVDRDRNYRSNALEFVQTHHSWTFSSNRCVPMLQVIYDGGAKITVNGCFYTTNNAFVVAFSDRFPQIIPGGGIDLYETLPRTLFKYPSGIFPGVLNDP